MNEVFHCFILQLNSYRRRYLSHIHLRLFLSLRLKDLLTTMCSWRFPLGYKIGLYPMTSFITDYFDISFERKHLEQSRLRPSLLPRWLYEATAVSLRPDETKKSGITDLNFVCPVLKSSPMTAGFIITWVIKSLGVPLIAVL